MRGFLTAALALALTGCGGGDGGGASSPTPSPTAAADEAPEVVFFQRQGLAGATLDTVSVREDGSVTRQRRYGGAGGRFAELRLEPGQRAKLNRALRSLPRGSSITRGSPPKGGAQYLIRVDGRTLTGRAGGIAPSARPAVKLLDGYIDGIGVVRVARDERTHQQ